MAVSIFKRSTPRGVAGNGPRAQVASAAVSYSLGQIAIGASYSSAQTPNLGLAAGTANANTVTVPPGANYTSPVDSGFSSAHAYQVLSLGASYSAGSVTLGVLYTNTRFRGLGDPSAGPNPLEYTGDANFHNVELNGRYSISPALSVGASYNVTTRNSVSTLHRPEGLGPARYLQAVVGIRYILQKTVFVYLEAMMQHASGVDSTGRSAVAANAALGASSSAQQSAMRAGLNVSF
ncbi:porin [Paraburkholderia bengalensis]|uniref:Porin n=1 Tax=Paraburkholderia bengalensis TaxID=2747562 RepID=A0ABU8J277_9BURK